MLQLTVLGTKFWDEDNEIFVYPESTTIELEHSLVTLSKWEEEFEKPFLSKDEKSDEEVMRYIELMIQTPNVPPELFSKFSKENFEEINAYINRKATATWFSEPRSGTSPPSREVISAELIYYWMVTLEMPMDPFQHWHLNRLFTQIKVFSVKNSKKEKMNNEEKKDWLADRARLNEERRKALGTTG